MSFTSVIKKLSELEKLCKDFNLNENVFESYIDEFITLVINQSFVYEHKLWNREGTERFIAKTLKDRSVGNIELNTYIFENERLLARVNRLNSSYHCSSKTCGGKKNKSHVIKLQGGEFCALCGETQALLQVDHIIPVNSGGEKDILSNLQLLCQRCNKAKSAYSDFLLNYITKTNISDKIGEEVRFKTLLFSCSVVDGRRYGTCQCGRTSKNDKLNVDKINQNFAANFPNLKVFCQYCK